MREMFGILAIVLVVSVLCTGAAALATDFEWDATTADTSWNTETNWDEDSGYPGSAGDTDNATITSGGNTCALDSDEDLTVHDLTLGGASPTKRKLHLESGSNLTVDGTMTLTDYAELDLDGALTVTGAMSLSGSIWIDGLFEADDLTIDGASTRLSLDTGGCCASAHFVTLTIDADAANATRTFKLIGGGSISVSDAAARLVIKSDDDADNRRAKLWLADGSIVADGELVQIVGGSTNLRRVDLDLDDNMSFFTALTTMTGYVSVDLADDVVLTATHLIIGGPATITVNAGTDAVMQSG